MMRRHESRQAFMLRPSGKRGVARLASRSLHIAGPDSDRENGAGNAALPTHLLDHSAFLRGFGSQPMIDGRDGEAAGNRCVSQQQQSQAIGAAGNGQAQSAAFGP